MVNVLHHAKAEQWLKSLPDNSKDGGISDFPYGLKFMGRKWDYDLPSIEALTEYYRVLKPGAFLLGFSSSRTYHRLACRLEDVGFEIRDCIMWIYGSGFPKSLNISKAFTKIGADKIAEIWKGWGTCLKPGYEPICIAMKPLDGTFTENADRWHVAGLNIDGCRVEYQNENDFKLATSERPNAANHNINRTKYNSIADDIMFKTNRGDQNGRYPSNVILNEETAKEIDEQSGVLNTCVNRQNKIHYGNNGVNSYKPTHKIGSETQSHNDIGGASRFFYCAKASQSDRNYGLQGKTNKHPTVKPVKLTRYLARLIKTPNPDAQYINPYSGSGTEMIGFILEGMDVEGCEMEQESFDTANERINSVRNNETYRTNELFKDVA